MQTIVSTMHACIAKVAHSENHQWRSTHTRLTKFTNRLNMLFCRDLSCIPWTHGPTVYHTPILPWIEYLTIGLSYTLYVLSVHGPILYGSTYSHGPTLPGPTLAWSYLAKVIYTYKHDPTLPWFYLDRSYLTMVLPCQVLYLT